MKNSLISNLKYSSSSSSSSSSGFHMSVAGGFVGVAALVFALIKDRKLASFSGLPQKLYLVPGLQNLGNNCFLNVILQALASCSYFQPSLQKVIVECDSSDIEEWSGNLQLTIALASLLEELSAFGEERVVLNPRNVMLAMTEYIQNFNLTSQQDS